MRFDLDALLEDIYVEYCCARMRFPNADPLLLLATTVPAGRKCNDVASQRRSLGNQKYNARKFLDALKLYTESISFATQESKELALAYGNRSAVLLQQRLYIPCLLDVNRALTSNNECPEESKVTLLKRKRDCLDKIRAEGNLHVVGDEDTIMDLPSIVWSSTLAQHGCKQDVICQLDNTLLPNTSSKVGLASDEKWGRYMIATSDIEPGEILSKEEFFTMILNVNRMYSHCSHCLVKCEALIPCSSCTQMMYCSDTCQKNAFDSYHRTECQLFSFYLSEELDPAEILAIRTFFVGTEQGARLKDLMKCLDVYKIFEEKVKPGNEPFKADYLIMLKQCWTFKKPSVECVSLAVTVAVLLQYLDFFDQNNADEKGSLYEMALLFFSSLLLINNVDSVKFHNHGAAEYLVSRSNPLLEAENEIGMGISPLHNMINHSCNPNTFDAVLLREHFMYAVRPIKKGDQIFISYCTSFTRNPISQRQETLTLYDITCQCEACINEWPTVLLIPSLISQKPEFLTKNKRIIKKVKTVIQKMIELGSNELVSSIEELQHIIACRRLVYDHVREPSAVIYKCEVLIVDYMRKRYGNYYVIN